MSVETPYQISVSDERLAQLKAKLNLVTFPDELEGAGWQYGAPLTDIKRLVARWKSDDFDWRKHEKNLNDALPQFTRDIEVEGHGTMNIHYVHQKSQCLGAIPLLFVHGWPGSFIEVRKILPLLTASSPNHPSFNVVAFSLPGYAFSEAPTKKGFGTVQYAEVGNKLMLALGYNEYVTQGGDWGYLITRKIANMYGGKHSKAWHTNMPFAQAPSPIWNPLLTLSYFLRSYTYTAQEIVGLEQSIKWQKNGQGYFSEQSTCPQTLGYSLADSPVGLLAWIYEKLVVWTDSYPWTDDEILTWISIYWFSRAGPAASVRIYYEIIQGGGIADRTIPTIPMGVSFFPKELFNLPRSWVRATGNVVFESEQTLGGHFAATENPAALVDDIRRMYGKGGPAAGLISHKTGYADVAKL